MSKGKGVDDKIKNLLLLGADMPHIGIYKGKKVYKIINPYSKSRKPHVFVLGDVEDGLSGALDNAIRWVAQEKLKNK